MTRPALLLLHGALGAADQMAPLGARLESRMRPLMLDLPGHGDAALPPGGFSIPAFADQIIARLEREQQGPVACFGYSMGGYAALEIARRRPDLLRGVVTLATKFAWTPEAAAAESRFLDPDRLRAKVPYFADQLAARHRALGWQTVLGHTAELMAGLGAEPLLTPEILSRIGCPVRVMVGDRDGTVSVHETEAAMRALPAGQLEVLPATPHPFEKAPLDRVARSIIEFFLGPSS